MQCATPGEHMNTLLKPFKAVIFDMDGVIVDSEPRHERAFHEVWDAMGYRDRHGINFQDYYGRSDRALWLDFIDKHRPPQSLDELTAWKQNRLIEILRAEQPIFDGLPEVVEKSAARWPLAVASGADVRADAVVGLRVGVGVVDATGPVGAGSGQYAEKEPGLGPLATGGPLEGKN